MVVKTKRQITRFAIDAMNKYHIDWRNLFDADNVKGDPIFRKEEVDVPTIKKLSNILGITEQDVLLCNKKAVNKWGEKYSFFKHFTWFGIAENAAQYAPNQYSKILHNAIFNEDPVPIVPRYVINKEDIEQRLLDCLKSFSRFNPKEYHEGAAIVNLKVIGQYFIDFPYLERMLESYLQMVNTAKLLFFKVLHKEADEEEINEYNFLVTVLSIKDRIVPSFYMYADWIDEIRNIMLEENYSDFFHYVEIPNSRNMALWRCKQFVNNVDLAQRYFEIFPMAKAEMREFYMEMKYFACEYNWSDDPKNPYADMDEDDLIDAMVASYDDDYDYNGGEISGLFTHEEWQLRKTYIPKTDEELGSDKEVIARLKRFSGCIKNGGVSVSNHYIEMTNAEHQRKFMQRALLMQGGQ